MEVVASLSQGRTAAAQCGLFTHKSVPVIFEPPCNLSAMNPARPGQGFKRCLSDERPATNRLRYGEARISTVV